MLILPAIVSSGLPLTYTTSDAKIATIVNGKLHIKAAGTVKVVASQVGSATVEALSATSTLVIDKATLTITVDSKSRKAGVANPAFTYTATGFVNGEGKAVITTQPVFSTMATIKSEAGSYLLTAAGAAAANYKFVYVVGYLGITPANQKLTGYTLTQPVTALPQPLVSKALSPNGDGVNDVLTIDNISNFTDNKLVVMDVNGNSVYEMQGYDNQSKVFDGHSTVTRAMVKPGTYYYLLEYKDQGELKRLTGYFLIKY